MTDIPKPTDPVKARLIRQLDEINQRLTAIIHSGIKLKIGAAEEIGQGKEIMSMHDNAIMDFVLVRQKLARASTILMAEPLIKQTKELKHAIKDARKAYSTGLKSVNILKNLDKRERKELSDAKFIETTIRIDDPDERVRHVKRLTADIKDISEEEINKIARDSEEKWGSREKKLDRYYDRLDEFDTLTADSTQMISFVATNIERFATNLNDRRP